MSALAIANSRGVPGTACLIVEDQASDQYVLANHHVVFGRGAAVGDPIWVLPPEDHEGGTPMLLGHAVRGQLGRVTHGGDACFVDCALVSLGGTRLPSWIEAGLAGVHEVGTAARGVLVEKTGPATGVTKGVVIDAHYFDQVVIAERAWAAPHQILVDSCDPELNFSGPGDSGAVLFDGEARAVGLVWGSNMTGQGIASPLGAVLDALGVEIIRTPRHS